MLSVPEEAGLEDCTPELATDEASLDDEAADELWLLELTGLLLLSAILDVSLSLEHPLNSSIAANRTAQIRFIDGFALFSIKMFILPLIYKAFGSAVTCFFMSAEESEVNF